MRCNGNFHLLFTGRMKKHTLGIRNKLIGIFVFIKVVPLIVLAWFSWHEISKLVDRVQQHYRAAIEESSEVTEQVIDLSTENSIRAMDLKSRESIERLTTDTARQVASFLYDRDQDIEVAAFLEPKAEMYEQFLAKRHRPLTVHDPMKMDATGEKWEIVGSGDAPDFDSLSITAQNKDNKKDFHARGPESEGYAVRRPLYLEMTFLDLNGKERVKVTTSDLVSSKLKDVSNKTSTFCGAETYYHHLAQLRPDEIYVSEVIGAYIKTHMIGPYTKKRAEKMGIEFAPEHSGYGGRENPVGKRFQGLIRWATPVVKKGKKIGYVTLALDHSHVMEFTDYIVPTDKRYTAISDGSTGNYAFMWDYKSRNISHPRDYFIVGYDPETGEEELPWLEKEHFYAWQKSGMTPFDFIQSLPLFHDQSLEKKPAREQIQSGLVALDCRYLNFAPQCAGWNNLTQEGGSGSFLIYWSGLWKLTTAATIPYYTGMYKDSPRGFGYVTIGANVNEFHRPAVETATMLEDIGQGHLANLVEQRRRNREVLIQTVRKTARDLTYYTGIMIVIVIIIAFWMASLLTGRITKIISSLNRFKKGEMDHRLKIDSRDEVEDLAVSFNEMADNIQQSIAEIQCAKELAERANVLLEDEIVERQNAEFSLAEYRDNLEELVSARTRELEQEIDERKQAERSKNELEMQLHRAEKMEALGTLGGGVGHDLNNILSGIATFPEVLLMNMAEDDPMYKPLKTIKMSGENAAAIVQDLLTLARRGVATSDIINFNDIVTEYLESPEHRKLMEENKTVAISVDLASDLLPTLGSRIHLLKTVMNLVSNGIESMTEEGGELSLRTENCYMDLSLSLYDEVVEGEYIAFIVTDNGMGISENDMERIFEPFFTKKKMGRSGTGLGMAVVWGAVHDHKGYINCQSEVDKGTVFTLYFPVCREEISPVKAISDLPTLIGNGEKILLVDDIPQQLDIASMILTNLNYDVATVPSGEEAIAYLKWKKADLLVLDMIMEPGMDGLDTYREIIKKHPGQKAIVASGYSETDRIRKAMKLGVKLYLKKPYSVANLGQGVKAGLKDAVADSMK